MGGTCLLIDLLAKSIFSKIILIVNFKILFSEIMIFKDHFIENHDAFKKKTYQQNYC